MILRDWSCFKHVAQTGQVVAQVMAHMGQSPNVERDDSIDPKIGHLIRQTRRDALVPVLNYGFMSFELCGKHHVCDFLEKVRHRLSPNQYCSPSWLDVSGRFCCY